MFLMIFEVRGVQVGRKNRSKIDQKGRSTWEGILASIFNGFWWIFRWKMDASWHPNGIKNRSFLENVEKQKMLIKPICF